MSGVMLDDICFSGGTREDGYINVARSPNGSWVRIPVIIVRGSQPGPVLMADACTHGDEYEGAEAIIRVAQELVPSEMKGVFVGVPALNYEAFCANSRISPIDNTNLNRIFPGSPSSFITQRVADAYLNRLVPHADYIINFHGGGVVLHLEPLVGYRPTDDAVGVMTRKMAAAFGTKVLWRMQNLPFDGFSTFEAWEKGVPAILPEIGSHCTRHHDRAMHVNLCATGIMNVMKTVGMLDGTPAPVKNQIDAEMQYIHTDAGGIHIPLKTTLEEVSKGEILAAVTDVFGNKIAEVVAPYDGVVLGYWSVPVIQPGDWSYLYGRKLI